jgi:hypothetical protein
VANHAAPNYQEQIASILRLRRARADAFGADLFGDIAWDILLQLFVAKLGGRNLKLPELAIPAPTSTVARWAAVLEERGFVQCDVDYLNPTDLSLELSSEGFTKMDELFRSLPHLQCIE